MRTAHFWRGALGAAMLALTACNSGAPAAPAGGGAASASNPVDAVELKAPVELTFWHRQTGDSEALQQRLIDEFMTANPTIKIKAESLGDYDKLYQKVLSSIQAGSPPDLVAAYESQAAEYMDAGALVPFDDYMNSAKYGLNEAERKDYIGAYIDATKFPQYGGKSLTFPYTKSDLVMYTNMEVLRSLGFQKPAATWTEFLDHCRKAVAGGKQCYAMANDPSTFAAWVFGFGGEEISGDGTKAQFDQPATTKVLELLETLYKEKLAYQIQGTDDQNDILSGRALYMMRSSTSVPRFNSGFKDNTKWEVSFPPQGTADKQVTTLYGANVSILKTTPEKQLAAWQFIKWLTAKDQTARWGLDLSNGYFPVRQSALDTPTGQKFMADNPKFKQAFDISLKGKVEPSVRGWQEARTYVSDAITSLMTGKATAKQAQDTLVQKVNKALSTR